MSQWRAQGFARGGTNSRYNISLLFGNPHENEGMCRDGAPNLAMSVVLTLGLETF